MAIDLDTFLVALYTSVDDPSQQPAVRHFALLFEEGSPGAAIPLRWRASPFANV